MLELLKEHLVQTNSSKANEILSNWITWKARFKVIVPPSEKTKLGLIAKEEMTN